jgi:hypothetical protein
LSYTHHGGAKKDPSFVRGGRRIIDICEALIESIYHGARAFSTTLFENEEDLSRYKFIEPLPNQRVKATKGKSRSTIP